MKNFTPLFIAIASLFSMGSFAQNALFQVNENMGSAQLMADNLSNTDLAVVSYHVEERINATFGGSITTYNVSNISLVGTNDLGGNNTRVVTPKYGKIKTRDQISAILIMNPMGLVPSKGPKTEIFVPKDTPKTVYIDLLQTYERVLEKGYLSIDMLKKVANGRYFDGDLTVSAKWYTKLFAMTTDFEPVYYFRYAASLKAIGQIEKSNEMIAIYESKSK